MGTNHLVVLSTEAGAVRDTGRTIRDLGAGVDPPLHAFGWSAPETGWSMIAQRVFFSTKNPRTRPGRDPIEGESSKALLRSAGRPVLL
jgi:hypothetical protein